VPENRCSAAQNDVYDATEWIWNHANELGLNTKQLAIAGEKSGAYFAAATALKARNTKGGSKFSLQPLVYASLAGSGSA
jgi:acetyl esterase